MRLRALKLNAYGGSSRVSFSPALLGPILWADASDATTITLNGSTVSQWSDKSGNGRHLVQATAAAQPTYNATTYNNKPAVIFDGTSDVMLSNSVTGISGAAPRTIAYVMRRVTGGPIIQIGTSTSLRTFGRDLAGAGLLYHWSSDLPMSMLGTGVNTSEILQSTGAVSTGFRDGSQIASGSYALNTLNTVLYVGARTPPDFSAVYAGVVFAEILVFNKVLSVAERQLLEGYFAWKWGAL